VIVLDTHIWLWWVNENIDPSWSGAKQPAVSYDAQLSQQNTMSLYEQNSKF